MLSSATVKIVLKNYGADLSGIASIDRFSAAPKGFHPRDLFWETESVIVFAKRLPGHTLLAESFIPYTAANNLIIGEVFKIAVNFALFLSDQQVKAVPIPSEPYEYWDPAQMRGQGLISLRHAGYLAGLGVLGRNNLLYNQKYGNMIVLGAVLADKALPPDPVINHNFCKETCQLCLKSCPAQALDGTTVNQKLCRQTSETVTPKGEPIYKCAKCRIVCPLCFGISQ